MGCILSQKKSNDHAKKPWESTFEEEKDEQGNLSRTARRQNTKKNTALTTFIAGRVYYYHYWCGRSLFFIAKNG